MANEVAVETAYSRARRGVSIAGQPEKRTTPTKRIQRAALAAIVTRGLKRASYFLGVSEDEAHNAAYGKSTLVESIEIIGANTGVVP